LRRLLLAAALLAICPALQPYARPDSQGKLIYFSSATKSDSVAKELPVYRICLADRKLQHMTDLTKAGALVFGSFGWWTGLGPDDSILALRDISQQELYALEMKFP
jgi:hypothetical protein